MSQAAWGYSVFLVPWSDYRPFAFPYTFPFTSPTHTPLCLPPCNPGMSLQCQSSGFPYLTTTTSFTSPSHTLVDNQILRHHDLNKLIWVCSNSGELGEITQVSLQLLSFHYIYLPAFSSLLMSLSLHQRERCPLHHHCRPCSLLQALLEPAWGWVAKHHGSLFNICFSVDPQ